MKYLYTLLLVLLALPLLAQHEQEAKVNAQVLPGILAPALDAGSFKTTTNCPDGVEASSVELFEDRSARDRVQMQPGDSIIFRSATDSQYFRVSSQSGDTTYSTVTQVAQSFTIDALGYDTLVVLSISSDLGFTVNGTEDALPAYVYSGDWVELDEDDNGAIDTANTIDTALVYPLNIVQSTEYVPSFIFDVGADIGRSQYDYSGFRTIEFNEPRNLLTDANFFANSTLFVSLGINGSDFDDDIFYSTSFEGLGQGLAKLFFQLTDEPTGTALNERWRNTIYNFTPSAQLDRDLNIIPTFYGAKCQTVSREEAFLKVNGLKLYSIYPNPVQNTANLAFELSDYSSEVLITIVDPTGRVHYTSALGAHLPAVRQTHALDLSDLSAGQYFIRLQTAVGSMATPLIKQ